MQAFPALMVSTSLFVVTPQVFFLEVVSDNFASEDTVQLDGLLHKDQTCIAFAEVV